MKKWWVIRAAMLLVISSVLIPGFVDGSGSAEAKDSGKEGVGEVPVPRSGGTFQVGEELEYRVSYSFFNIGIVKFRINDRLERNGRVVYRAHAMMDSNPALNWLTELHIRFYGEFDDDGFSNWWISDDSSRQTVQYRRMFFDYGKKKMFFDRGRKNSAGDRISEFRDTINVAGYSQDGMSLFFYARNFVHQRKQVRVPTFVDHREEFTNINFTNERWSREIDACEYPVETIRLDGRAEFVGVYGMTGGFEGWFTNDEASIPVTARMKVILGSVKIELVKWSRPGWQLPRYVE